jgi:GDP-D-mannose dehydratase
MDINYIVIQDGFVSDYEMIVSNPSVMINLGWKPKVNFYQLTEIMVETR